MEIMTFWSLFLSYCKGRLKNVGLIQLLVSNGHLYSSRVRFSGSKSMSTSLGNTKPKQSNKRDIAVSTIVTGKDGHVGYLCMRPHVLTNLNRKAFVRKKKKTSITTAWPVVDGACCHYVVREETTLNKILSVTYFMELRNVYLFIVYLVFYQQMLNWLFGHYRTLPHYLVKIDINGKNI